MSLNPTTREALAQAIDQAGSQTAFATVCEVSQAAVWKWLNSAKRLPAEYVLTVEAATGIPRHLLRTDIYPADLGPSPAWQGVDHGAQRVSFNRHNTLHGRAA